MTARRPLVALAAAAWLAPSALVAGLALHVALHHAHAPAVSELADLVEHGHAHVGDTAEHGHEVAVPPDATVRRLLAGAALPDPSAGAAAGAAAPLVLVAGPPPAPPPRLTGQLLLSLLSTLRI